MTDNTPDLHQSGEAEQPERVEQPEVKAESEAANNRNAENASAAEAKSRKVKLPPRGAAANGAAGAGKHAESNPSTQANGPTVAELQAQLAEALAKSAENLEGWQRSRAEFINYRKRVEKEREEVYQLAAVDTLRKLLPVLDDFDRAVTNVPSDLADHDVIKGFNLIYRKLMSLLENSSVKQVNPVGEAFDPALHEAIGQDDNASVPSGHVTAVLQKGYVFGDRVLRPALVRVAS
jgi:molecular chaperone GrpE